MRNPRQEFRAPRQEIGNPRAEMPNPRQEFRNPRQETRSPRAETRDPRQEIGAPPSGNVANPFISFGSLLDLVFRPFRKTNPEFRKKSDGSPVL